MFSIFSKIKFRVINFVDMTIIFLYLYQTIFILQVFNFAKKNMICKQMQNLKRHKLFHFYNSIKSDPKDNLIDILGIKLNFTL